MQARTFAFHQEIHVPLRTSIKNAFEWQTVDARLVVIGPYRLGFELEPRGEACELRVFIDYDWPRGLMARRTAALLAGSYARWCVQRMSNDAAKHFAVCDSTGRRS